jgi:hypothetical protein
MTMMQDLAREAAEKHDAAVMRVVAAVMISAGLTEVRVTDELLAGALHGGPPTKLIAYRDGMFDTTVFRLVRDDVIEGEEVPYLTTLPASAGESWLRELEVGDGTTMGGQV